MTRTARPRAFAADRESRQVRPPEIGDVWIADDFGRQGPWRLIGGAMLADDSRLGSMPFRAAAGILERSSYSRFRRELRDVFFTSRRRCSSYVALRF